MPKASKRSSRSSKSSLVFERQNYVLLVVSALLIAGGFLAMYIDGQFLGFVSLTISPITIVAGYGLLIYAIMKRPNDTATAPDEA